ncbi:Aromatic prenyltransferase, DMATS type [Penicillium camemberti]|uniref:Aromatic prenyltransferase, DMATS type n=1 Tax=Penicillium camemberti (strain FM 013) TaxID=1429867 RepID=A0A0G4P250_PENC3|nr:Aromatic prenyltransferase, DMATS type [Penicillium camemberti]
MTVVNDKMAVRGADKPQFELLDKSLNCPVDDQRDWWQKTGPLLASLMTSAGYTNESQRQHLMFFYTAVVPYLGPYPQKFPSAMTHNELPLELSVNFQQLGGARPVIRVAVEPVTSISGTKEDPYNMSPIRDILSHLEKLNIEGYDPRLFEHFYPKHTLDKIESQKLQQKNESIRELSQVAFGFDLKPDRISVKGYTFPGLKCHLTGKDMCSVVTESIQEYLGDADRYNTIGLMKDYIETTEARANFGFVYSNDCVTPEKSRHKIYGRTKDMSWNQVKEIWAFGGRIDSPESNKGLDYLQRLWELLEIGNGPHPLDLHLVWNYETKAGMKVPATKIYFPVYGLNDQKNVRAIVQYLKEIGLDIRGDAYEQDVQDLFPGFDIQQTDRLICWVSFAYTEKTGVYLSVYYHSSLEYPWLEKKP